MRLVFIPTALWVFFRRIGHANSQLRDLVMDAAWRDPNALIIRKSGSIRARNGPKRRKRKKKKEKRKKNRQISGAGCQAGLPPSTAPNF
jgi:hypothetical protein